MAIGKKSSLTTEGIMVRVVIALVPGLAVAAWALGVRALLVVAVSTVTAVATEVICTRTFKHLSDFSAVVSGALIGLCMPPTVPLWIAGVGSVIGVGLGKHAFGGLGKNLFNPAMVGYAAVLVSFPDQLTHYDAVTGATALEVVSHRGGTTLAELADHSSLGYIGAKSYEWINGAFLVGGCYLVAIRVVSWHMPLAVLLGVIAPTVVFFDAGSASSWGSPLFHCFAGGTMLTAFFIATDPVTSPSNPRQQWIYGFFIGAATMLIRKYGSWPDGFAFAVLLANVALPLIEGKSRITALRNR